MIKALTKWVRKIKASPLSGRRGAVVKKVKYDFVRA